MITLPDLLPSDHISIYAHDLSSPDPLLSLHLCDRFISASMIKLPILAYATFCLGRERISLDDLFTISYAGMEESSHPIPHLVEHFTLYDVIRRMIIYSDNACTNALIDLLGMDALNLFFSRDLALQHTLLQRKMLDWTAIKQGKNNYTSLADIVSLFHRLHNHSLLGVEESTFMLDILSAQTDHDGIMRFLPPDFSFAGKSGGLDGIAHDVGIVSANGKELLIGVMLQSQRDSEEMLALIGTIAQRAAAQVW